MEIAKFALDYGWGINLGGYVFSLVVIFFFQ